ncbi:hypothetical protein DVA86_07700 [Streptomyces armeniacus]|uniref:OmpR/PhoB-type domain-containing protein n=1 Tax=Streptomyces armeniacus TaxID=83291 RepID=A0A345XLN4_9ACTN|nr:hypothetical protein DVA86_07700 [Streptomyces armeniacus]
MRLRTEHAGCFTPVEAEVTPGAHVPPYAVHRPHGSVAGRCEVFLFRGDLSEVCVVKFNVLGRLEVIGDAGDCVPSAPKQRQLLVLLLTNANRVTSTETITSELWSGSPPARLATTIQTYVYQLRRRLVGDDWKAMDLIATCPSGYLIRADVENIDMYRFEQAVQRARTCLAMDPENALQLLSQAQPMWRGAAFADVPRGPLLQAHAARLEEFRMEALELWIEAGLRSGRHRELVAEITSLILLYPFNEQLHGQLMRALAMGGRRREALEVYQRLRRTLQRDLGVEPTRALKEIQQRVLMDNFPSLSCHPDARVGPRPA